jgi:putative SOS response-associated peptidase YedK
MCGRSTLHDAPTNILERFSLPPMLPEFVPRYNVAPSQLQWAITRDRSGAANVRQLKWGFIPWWADEPSIGNRMINARAESLAEKPAFRDSLREKRCLILADGWYEWRGKGKDRVPVHFRLSDGRPFGIAGLWDRWSRVTPALETCTVVTTNASTRARAVHDRMPVIFVDDAVTAWVDGSASLRDLVSLLRPYEGNDLELFEVSRYVNNPANDSPECLNPESVL